MKMLISVLVNSGEGGEAGPTGVPGQVLPGERAARSLQPAGRGARTGGQGGVHPTPQAGSLRRQGSQANVVPCKPNSNRHFYLVGRYRTVLTNEYEKRLQHFNSIMRC
jgi:hypothetical protein